MIVDLFQCVNWIRLVELEVKSVLIIFCLKWVPFYNAAAKLILFWLIGISSRQWWEQNDQTFQIVLYVVTCHSLVFKLDFRPCFVSVIFFRFSCTYFLWWVVVIALSTIFLKSTINDGIKQHFVYTCTCTL